MKTWQWLSLAGAATWLLLLGTEKKKASPPVQARPFFDRRELEHVIACLVASPFNLDITPGTWTHGGCWILADAVQRIYGGELWVVESSANEVEHFVVRFGKAYVDGDGVQTRAEILEKIGQERKAPRLLRYHSGLDTGGIIRPEESVKGAVVILQKCARDGGFMLPSGGSRG